MQRLLPLLDAPVADATDSPDADAFASALALRFGDRELSHAELAACAAAPAARLAEVAARGGRVAVWATPSLDAAVAVVAALRAGVPAVPLNPRSGERELAHILADSAPELLLAGPEEQLPPALAGLERLSVPVTAAAAAAAAAAAGDGALPPAPAVDPERPALVVYTSGTTGAPKGVLLSHRAIAASLDALATTWSWTAADLLVHALPLFHVHGLILGTLGPLRIGGSVRHLGRFEPEAVAQALSEGGTMLFGVPTMYHRLAEALPGNPELAKALAGARLLVSGSAALPLPDQRRITAATGRQVVERYGMTETLMNTSVPPEAPARPGTVGLPLPGVELRLVDEAGAELHAADGEALSDSESVGEIQVRGPNLFSGYLNRPDATAEAFAPEGWFRTGDMATRDADGWIRIVGRKATDLIKSGGYKIGAGEIENVLLDHPAVAEAAVTGEPDADLGERIIAWVVPASAEAPPTAAELSAHVAAQLAPHKRPREVRFLSALPRNDLGKVMKRALPSPE